jgi:hypothetical protein
LQQLIKLYQQVDGLTADIANNMAEMDKNAGVVNKQITRLTKELNSVDNSFSSISQSLKDSIGEFTKINNVASSTKKSFTSLQSIASKLANDQVGYSTLSAKELVKLKEKVALEAQNLKQNLSLGKLNAEQTTETEGVLKGTKDLLYLLDKRLKKEKEITQATGLTGNALKALSKIPGLGSALNTEEAQQAMRDTAESMQAQGKNINSFSNKLKIAGAGITESFKGIKASLTDPVSILTFFVTQALKANTQAVELGKSLGYGTSRANAFRESFVDIERSSHNLNVNVANLTEAFNQLTKATGFAYQFSADQLETQIKLTKQVGLTAEEAGNIANFGIANGKTSEQTYSAFVKGLVATRNQLKVGIDLKATLAEAANVSGQLAANLGYNPERIAKAIVTAKAFGMTLEQVSKSGDSLLNWESSIESELKAELLTGKQLNLERARAAALAGDQATLAEEISKNVGSAADFAKMNVLQQKALAEAVGMTADELSNTLRKREQALASGKSLAQINEEEAKQALERQTIQDKFNSAVLKLQSLFGNLMAGPLGGFLDLLSGALGIVNSIGHAFSFLATPLKIIAGLMGGIWLIGKGMALTEGLTASIMGEKAGFAAAELGSKIASNTATVFGNAQAAIGLATEEGVFSWKSLNSALENETLATKITAYGWAIKDRAMAAASVLISKARAGWEAITNEEKQAGLLLSIREAWASIAGAAMSAFESVAKIPYIGWILGGIAAAGAIALGTSLMTKIGDGAFGAPAAGGGHTITTSEGSMFQTSKNDQIAVGPSVVDTLNDGSEKSNPGSPSIDLTPMIAAINEVKAAVDNLINRPVILNIDSKQVGSSMVQGSYKVA